MSISEFLYVFFFILIIAHHKSIARCAKAWFDFSMFMLFGRRKHKREIAEIQREIDRIQALMKEESK